MGTPSNITLKLLTKEIFANACAIPSTYGCSGHGHLSLVMSAPEYMIVAGIGFQLPVHPGDNPVIPANVTQFQIAKAMHTYKATLAELTLATTIKEEMKKQLLAAVNHLYVAKLDMKPLDFLMSWYCSIISTSTTAPSHALTWNPTQHCNAVDSQ